MARKSNASSDGPSTADVSANEDVEMQDQETTQLSGLKKLGVSAPPWFLPTQRCGDEKFPGCGRYVMEFKLTMQSQYFQDTPDYTVRRPLQCARAIPTCKLTLHQDSDTNPNTTASSVAGDVAPDGRKKRAEVMNMRKSIIGKKHDRLGASKVCTGSGACA
jgi:SWI/SNF-related matrix-associated actin-dependent regulator of chromatin subfamily A member 5